MADEYGNLDEDPDETVEQEKPSSLRAKLRDAATRAADRDQLAEENAALKQQIAVTDSGLSLNETQRKALLAVTADLTPEQLRKTAQDLGFVTAPPPVPDDPSLTVHSQIAAAAAGAETSVVDRDAEIDRLIENATTEEELLAVYRTSGRPML